MASTPSTDGVATRGSYRRFVELVFVSVPGHLAFALYYGFQHGQWRIAALLIAAGLMVLALFPLFRSTLPDAVLRVAGHLVMAFDLGCVLLALRWMGMDGATMAWWLVWWPMFVTHLIGWKDGLAWVGVAVLALAWSWSQAWMNWSSPLMRLEDQSLIIVQLGFLWVGVGVSLIVRRAYDRYEATIAARQTVIDAQNEILERRAERLESMLEAVQQSSLERTRMFAQISHEVRTPLNGLLGFIDLMKRTELAPQQASYLAQISTCGQSVLQMVNEVLDFSRLESHATELASQPYFPQTLIREAVDMMSAVAAQKGVTLVCDLPDEGVAEAVGDPLRVKQVLLNLLANAVKFTPAGEVAVRCRVSQEAAGQAVLHVEVQDSGIGIPTESVPYLFQPFSRANDRTVREFGGSGLGLAVCKRLIDMMQGRIGVDSRPGQGSLFWFQVPMLPG